MLRRLRRGGLAGIRSIHQIGTSVFDVKHIPFEMLFTANDYFISVIYMEAVQRDDPGTAVRCES